MCSLCHLLLVLRFIDLSVRLAVFKEVVMISYSNHMSIIKDNTIHMATLCVAASHSVNGVSKLHSEIIKQSVFHDEYENTPEKFKNVTNGIAYRRWLSQSNPALTKLIGSAIGKKFIKK